MHILVGLLVLAIVGWLAWRTFFAGGAGAASTPAERSARAFVYLAQGKLFERAPGQAVEEVHSHYVQETMERREQARDRHGWKQGTSFGISSTRGMRDFQQADAPIVATSAVYQPDGGLLYFLKDDSVGGLFRREPGSGRELRLLLRQKLHLTDLCLAPDGGQLAASSQKSGATAHIVLLGADGAGLREVTGGDTLDTAPAWIPGAPHRLLFQSSGLARDESGYVVAQGAVSIQKLDMESGRVTPILDDPKFDHLKPRVCPQGHLHFIRRPFEQPSYGPRSLVLDTLLFPFRLLRAVFHYLNIFSLMYTRKPLTSANGPTREADLKQLLVQGRRIDAERASRKARAVHGVPSLVPDNWQLVRRDDQGAERVLASNVASYDIGPDGTIVYSNGHGVFVLEGEGGAQVAMAGTLVGEVVAAL